jgi:hypothetical protein
MVLKEVAQLVVEIEQVEEEKALEEAMVEFSF